MKIYTKTGDSGKTSLAQGGRVSKSNPLVDLYGTCDELNSSLGIVISFLDGESDSKSALVKLQSILFELGSELAGFRKNSQDSSIILDEDISFLESEIDRMEGELEPLRAFVLPGGSRVSSFLHLSRTICRRLERGMVKEMENGVEIFQNSLIFVNRFSDYLFVLSRFENKKSEHSETKWISRAKSNN